MDSRKIGEAEEGGEAEPVHKAVFHYLSREAIFPFIFELSAGTN